MLFGPYPWTEPSREQAESPPSGGLRTDHHEGLHPDASGLSNQVSRESAQGLQSQLSDSEEDWREDLELVARLRAAYLEERNRVEELDGPWYANEKIGTKAMAKIEQHPGFREIVPAPDIGFLQELPERDLNEAAHLLRDTILLNWSLGSRPYAPFADKSSVKDTLANGARAFSIPVTTLLQDVVGKEQFDWPEDLLLEAGMMRDQAVFDASHLRATQVACQTAALRAVERVGIAAGQFHLGQDLPQFSTEYKAAVDAEGELSQRYWQDIRDLVDRYAE